MNRQVSTMGRRAAAAVPFLAFALPLAAQQIALPADWGERDVEGKWIVYRRDVDAHPQDADRQKKWAQRLGEQKELELLETIAIYEGWRHAGPVLHSLDAPAVYRVALWNLAAVDSHNGDTARKVLLADPPRALGWFERHPDAQRGRGKAIHDQLVATGAAAGDPRGQLPPLDPRQLLVPQLDVPARLAGFGDRLRAEPRVRYVHQTVRALRGLAVWGEPEAMHLHKVVGLFDHEDAEVRAAAFATLTVLPGHLLPMELLLRRAENGSDELRRLATSALSFVTHPRAWFELHRIALDPAHPASASAMLRLGDVGDAWTLAQLQAAAARTGAEPEIRREMRERALRRLGERLREVKLAETHTLVRRDLERVAWLRSVGDPRGDEVAAAIAGHLRPRLGGSVASVVDAALEQAMPDPFLPAERERVQAELQRFAAELREAAAGTGGGR